MSQRLAGRPLSQCDPFPSWKRSAQTRPGSRLDRATRRPERAPGAAESTSPSRWRCVIRRLARCEPRRRHAARPTCSAHHGAAVPPIGAHHSLPEAAVRRNRSVHEEERSARPRHRAAASTQRAHRDRHDAMSPGWWQGGAWLLRYSGLRECTYNMLKSQAYLISSECSIGRAVITAAL